MSVDVPSVSSSVNESVSICLKRLWRSPADVPTAAFAAKYCAVKLLKSPKSAIKTIIAKCPAINFLSPPAIPISIICTTISGTKRSHSASIILKSGARRLSFIYFLKKGIRYFKFYLSSHQSSVSFPWSFIIFIRSSVLSHTVAVFSLG